MLGPDLSSHAPNHVVRAGVMGHNLPGSQKPRLANVAMERLLNPLHDAFNDQVNASPV